jgi:hypothetical protein
MKKKLLITSTMAMTLAALSGCSSGDDWNEDVIASDDTAICVDQNGTRIEDEECDKSRYTNGGSRGSFFYFARGARLPYIGDSLRDSRYKFAGYSKPMVGVKYNAAPSSTGMSRSSAIARGGFGSGSRSYGGGRS